LLLKNTVANTISRFWSIISIYLFVPLWIKYLGIEGYGIINFYTVLVTIFAFADAGLTATLTREFARENVPLNYRANLLRTFEYIYIGIGLFIIIFVFIFSNNIVDLFLKTDNINRETLNTSVRLMGIILGVQLMYTLYNGGLMGIQKQVLSNSLNVIYSFSRSALVLIPLYFFPNVICFFLWQLVSLFLVCIISRKKIYSFIVNNDIVESNFSYLKNIWRYSLGMALMAIISALNTQLDKLLVGNILSLKDFGYYSLASNVGQLILMVCLPIGQAFYPELVRLVSVNDKSKLLLYYRGLSFLVATVAFAIGFVVISCTYDYILIWTSNSEISEIISTPAKLLIVANIFLSLQYSSYFLALSYAYTRTNVTIGIASLIFFPFLVYFLVTNYGLNGAAIPFLILNVIGFFLLSYLIINRFLKGEFKKWLIQCFISPLLLNLFISITLFFIFRTVLIGYFTILYGALSISISLYLSLCLLNFFFPNFINEKYKKIILPIFNKN